MTVASRENAGIQPQRGFWLRCFLGKAPFALAICLGASGLAWARVEPQGPIHLWRLHGIFLNAAGRPIENEEVTLQRDGVVVQSTRTDGTGTFAFDHVYGHYSLHIARSPDHSQLLREVIIGEAATLLRGSKLYVIAGPAACTDDCSSVFTSKSDFEKAVRRKTQHSQ